MHIPARVVLLPRFGNPTMRVLLGLPVRHQIAESFSVLREQNPMKGVGSRNNPMTVYYR